MLPRPGRPLLAGQRHETYVVHARALPGAGEPNVVDMRAVLDIVVERGSLPSPPLPLERYADTTYVERARR